MSLIKTYTKIYIQTMTSKVDKARAKLMELAIRQCGGGKSRTYQRRNVQQMTNTEVVSAIAPLHDNAGIRARKDPEWGRKWLISQYPEKFESIGKYATARSTTNGVEQQSERIGRLREKAQKKEEKHVIIKDVEDEEEDKEYEDSREEEDSEEDEEDEEDSEEDEEDSEDDEEDSEDDEEDSEDDEEDSEDDDDEENNEYGIKYEIESDEEPSYEVDKIVAKRENKGKIEYKVHWKGFKNNEDTWEPRKQLMENASEAVKKYEKSISNSY
jgi:hypothetical protein